MLEGGSTGVGWGVVVGSEVVLVVEGALLEMVVLQDITKLKKRLDLLGKQVERWRAS
jgi:hypothetical protein